MRVRGIAVTVTAVLLAGCGAKQPTTVLSAHGSRSEVTIDDPVTISGVVRLGSSPASMDLDLSAATAPLYNDTHRVAHTRSDSHGQFGFAVRPEKNTAYTVAAADATRNVVVFASPRYSLQYTRAAGGGIDMTFTVDHPATLKPTARRVYFYAGRRNVGKLMLLGSAPLVAMNATRAEARGALSGAPAGRVDAFACLRTEIAPGYGAPPVKGCGASRLSR